MRIWRLTSRSLKAARLFKPCTLASAANLSAFCRTCHLFEDDDDERVHRLDDEERACNNKYAEFWRGRQAQVNEGCNGPSRATRVNGDAQLVMFLTPPDSTGTGMKRPYCQRGAFQPLSSIAEIKPSWQSVD